jgi:hypothetical protein
MGKSGVEDLFSVFPPPAASDASLLAGAISFFARAFANFLKIINISRRSQERREKAN